MFFRTLLLQVASAEAHQLPEPIANDCNSLISTSNAGASISEVLSSSTKAFDTTITLVEISSLSTNLTTRTMVTEGQERNKSK